MYPSTTFIIEDRSHITDLLINEQNPSPLFAQFFTSDKGPEEMGEYFGKEFEVYGEPNFARHGQPLLQAQRLINSGSRVLAKRVVAPDSTLANLIILAKVKSESTQKVDADGNPLYMTPDGKETTDPYSIDPGDGDLTATEPIDNTPIILKKCQISYTLESIPNNNNDIDLLKIEAEKFADYEGKTNDEEKTYPICIIADNGRGVSSKKIRITANVAGSRNSQYMTYIFSVIEDSVVLESTLFTLNPEISTATANLSLESVAKTYLNQVRVFVFDNAMIDFLNTVKEITDIDDLDNTDVLFGKNKKGIGLDVFEITGDVNLSLPIGLPLSEGSNGSFGNFPLKAINYTAEMVKAFDGTYTNDVFDVDNILLDGILDANYPMEVKKAIEDLITFREDAFFFRDIGVTSFTSEDVQAQAEIAADSRYIGVYGNSYDVIDEYSKKQINVTMTYTLGKLLPKHFANNRHAPIAGSLYGFIFDEIVEGTVNFLPKIIPGKNQKDELFSKHINFISYLDKLPVLESEYTTQEEHTGFSYINNTLAVQEVIKDIRRSCPKSRYSFMEEEDLIKYEEDVQVVLNQYTSNFSELRMEYAADPVYEQNMTYYAILYVKFKKFVQAEVFRIIAINDNDIAAI